VFGLALTTLAACGSDDGGGDGPGGSAGSSGAAGSGGSGGSGASGGSGGSGGTGGGAGDGGSGGSAGASGAAGSAGTGGSAGSGGTNNCNDPGPEPNDSLPQATPTCSAPPCEIDDCDGSGSTVTGTIGPDDVDLHAYFGNDNVGCQVNASVSTEDSGYRLCLFTQCADGAQTTLIACHEGSTQEAGPSGYQGCCVTAPGTVEVEHDCPGLDESAGVYIRIDEANACVDYSVDYHY
jgi:hypothetical protein